MQKTSRVVLAAAVKAKQEQQMRTCCNCFHIKHGTIILGLLELLAIALILSGILKQLVVKSREASCHREFLSRLFRACYQWSFSTLDWTLAGDYFITFLLFTITVCILLLFLGIVKKSPYLLLPHLLVQGIFLVSSLAYFFLYAWSYFYIDLYQQKGNFQLMAFLERMWLATLLLILDAFQLYIFFSVIKCCLYLQDQRNQRLRRIRQFEECSKRVRDAKQNGLWRSTSWGGGFQQYIGEYDNQNHKPKRRDKPAVHVQWDLQANREKTISIAGTDDQSESTTDSVTTKKPERTKLKNHVGSASPKVNNKSGSTSNNSNNNSTKRSSRNVEQFENRQTTAITNLPTAVKEKFEKQFPKAILIQPVQPIIHTATVKHKISTYDNANMIKPSHAEQRSRSLEKGNNINSFDRPRRLSISTQMSDNMTRSAALYHGNVKRISISSTTPPPLIATPTQLHSMLH